MYTSQPPAAALKGSFASRFAGAWHSLQAKSAWVDILCVRAA